MRPGRIGYLSVTAAAILTAASLAAATAAQGDLGSRAGPPLIARMHAQRAAATDLEIGGNLAGLFAGTTRYLTRDDLLALPQVTYTVTDDSNFTRPTKVSGVPLEDLLRDLSAAPQSALVVAICDDKYHASYPRDYMAAHHPLLVLEVNGKPPSDWPKDSAGHGFDLGPYMISHEKFTPAFKILAHPDEAQIPWGVVRLEFRDERAVFGAIAPRGPNAKRPAVQAGYKIARQNCFRCHNNGADGGQKSGVTWAVLSAFATSSPDFFKAYVRNPKSKRSEAQMPGNPEYDDGTMRVLTAYFRTFLDSRAGMP
ncbi:MAG TPA: c-type cytochrome [Candidatus Acidoferrales bacterium]|jgi:mono/diheme cytochrome c family protein|nr:c-type cytochrome [Candidatus Acidoferrales bacterium]